MSKQASRRQRRRMRARIRDLARHGIAQAPPEAKRMPQRHVNTAYRLHREAVRDAWRYRKPGISTPQAERSHVVLQEITAGRPKGKRRIRYTTVTPWRGTRPGYSDERDRITRMKAHKRRKGAEDGNWPCIIRSKD